MEGVPPAYIGWAGMSRIGGFAKLDIGMLLKDDNETSEDNEENKFLYLNVQRIMLFFYNLHTMTGCSHVVLLRFIMVELERLLCCAVVGDKGDNESSSNMCSNSKRIAITLGEEDGIQNAIQAITTF
eukprot:11077816-Ditylum_brightwellii.AAC.1